MKLKLTKLDAAVRQLNAAITLWFQDGDAVSIHTLASASHQVIYDVVRFGEGPALLFDSLIFRDEYRSRVGRILREPQNFFKHADSDPHGELVFDPRITDMFLMTSLQGLEFLNLAHDSIQSAYLHWFALTHPEFLTEKGRMQFAPIQKKAAELDLTSSKWDFFQLYQLAHGLTN